jgi:hypothetical protein
MVFSFHPRNVFFLAIFFKLLVIKSLFSVLICASTNNNVVKKTNYLTHIHVCFFLFVIPIKNLCVTLCSSRCSFVKRFSLVSEVTIIFVCSPCLNLCLLKSRIRRGVPTFSSFRRPTFEMYFLNSLLIFFFINNPILRFIYCLMFLF